MGVKGEFEVDGERYASEDHILTGRQILSLSDHNPAADYRLIQLHHRYTSSIGLEDTIELVEGQSATFRAFENDRTYDFTLEDMGCEWGEGSISDADLRMIGGIPADRDLVVDVVGEGERLVPHGGKADLSGHGVERIYSRHTANVPETITILVAGEAIELNAAPQDILRDLLDQALKESENTGQPVDSWYVTDKAGTTLELTETLKALGVHMGAVLIASLKTGAAG